MGMCSYKTNGHLLNHKTLAMKDANSIYIIIPDLCFQQEIFRKHKLLEAKRTRVLQGWCDFSLDLVLKYYIKQKIEEAQWYPNTSIGNWVYALRYINIANDLCVCLYIFKSLREYMVKVLIWHGELLDDFQLLFYVLFVLSKTCLMRIYLSLAQINKYISKYGNQ